MFEWMCRESPSLQGTRVGRKRAKLKRRSYRKRDCTVREVRCPEPPCPLSGKTTDKVQSQLPLVRHQVQCSQVGRAASLGTQSYCSPAVLSFPVTEQRKS